MFYPVYDIWEMYCYFYSTGQNGEFFGTYTAVENNKIVLFNLNEEGKLERRQ
jgi:hypothetical protein